VQLAVDRHTDELVVVKSIQKNKVLDECWTNAPKDLEMNDLAESIGSDEFAGRIPREILLMRSLQHDNIVKLVDVYQSPAFYQLVMPHNGTTFDLFEFIEENGPADEALASHIFRQVRAPVSSHIGRSFRLFTSLYHCVSPV